MDVPPSSFPAKSKATVREANRFLCHIGAANPRHSLPMSKPMRLLVTFFAGLALGLAVNAAARAEAPSAVESVRLS
jgi:hypothetical protein